VSDQCGAVLFSTIANDEMTPNKYAFWENSPASNCEDVSPAIWSDSRWQRDSMRGYFIMHKKKKEVWKPIPGFPGYEVSNAGQVRSFHKHFGKRGWGLSDKPVKILSPHCGHNGYYSVNLRKNRKTYRRRIGTLVILAFMGPRPDGMEVCHNDGNPSHDHLDNLRYDTHKSNIQDASRHGTLKGTPKFTNSQVKAIRSLYSLGNISQSELAEKFHVHRSSISLLLRGETYKKAGGPIFVTQRRKLTTKEVRAIREQRAMNVSLKDVATKHKLSISCISRIARGKRHRIEGATDAPKYQTTHRRRKQG